MELVLSSWPLAVFTTLAPAGMAAFAVMALVRLRCPRPARGVLLDGLLGLPFLLVLSGFITSTAHLGTPANALYVLVGVGRSPLSNEVLSVVAFLVLSGSYWMCTLMRPVPPRLARAWLAAGCLAAAAALWFTSQAYSVATIPAWNLPHMPAALVVGALGLGALVACAVLTNVEGALRKPWVLLACYGVSCVAVCALLALYVHELAGIETFYAGSPADGDAAPAYAGGYAVLSLAALVLAARALRCPKGGRTRRLVFSAAAALCGLAGFMLTRLLFYASYMTIGL